MYRVIPYFSNFGGGDTKKPSLILFLFSSPSESPSSFFAHLHFLPLNNIKALGLFIFLTHHMPKEVKGYTERINMSFQLRTFDFYSFPVPFLTAVSEGRFFCFESIS